MIERLDEVIADLEKRLQRGCKARRSMFRSDRHYYLYQESWADNAMNLLAWARAYREVLVKERGEVEH